MTSVAIIVLDTLRKDAFDAHFDWLPGVRFENAYSTSHYTVPAHASLFTGRYASEVGVHKNNEALDYPGPVLSEQLQKNGITTRGWTANLLLSPWNQWDRGFDEYELGWRVRAASPDIFDWRKNLKDFSDTHRIERLLRVIMRCILHNTSTRDSLDIAWKLKHAQHDGAPEAHNYVTSTEFGDEEFLFMNLLEAHLPYRPPEKYRTVDVSTFDDTSSHILGGDTDCTVLRQAYNDSVRYLSEMYQQIFAKLRNEFEYIITLSDHGELFGEHNARAHWYGVFPELTHVPLSIWNGESGTKHRDETVSLLDVHQTILSIAGVDARSQGRDLRGDFQKRAWLTEFHGLRPARIDSLKNQGFDETAVADINQALYGLATPDGFYGWQTIDGFHSYGQSIFNDPKKRLIEEIQNLDIRTVQDDKSTNQLDVGTQKQLKDLGYL